jgi:DNA-directed RNA polymerase subunit N (RpoN/RPB10)
MIIPVRCFTCGKVIADKYQYFTEQVRAKKMEMKVDENKVIYLTSEYRDKTPEGIVMDELKLTSMCCRRHFLTHVDID